MYLVVDDRREALLIDPAMGERQAIAAVGDGGFRLVEILNTHGHPDHVYGNAAVKEATRARLAIHRLDAYRLGPERPETTFEIPPCDADDLFDEGALGYVADLEMRALHLPGHTEGSTCFYFPTENVLFSGDVIFKGSTGRWDLPGGDREQMERSFERLRYFVRLAVDPRLRRRGIGAAMWGQLRAELDERAATVACLWVSDATACHSFIAERGFVEVVRSYEQVVALATARLPLAAAEEAVAAQGITVETLSALIDRDGDDGLGRVHDLYTASRVDQPTLGHVTARPFADWRREVFDELHLLPDAFFVARDRDRLVGCSGVHRFAEEVLRILITGVLPEYRRRGIARVLKLRVHAWARAHGYREIHTSTANAATVALNI